MNLYNLTGQYLELLDMASEDDPAFADTLESITAEIATKTDDYIYVMQSMDDQLANISSEIKRLTEMKTAIEDNKKRMKDTLYKAMKSMDKDEIKTDFHSVKISKVGGKRKMVLDVEDVDKLPLKYVRTTIVPDTDAIRKDLEAGMELTYAHLEERGETVRIK